MCLSLSASLWIIATYEVQLRRMRDSNPHRLAPGGFQDRCNTNYANPPKNAPKREYKYKTFVCFCQIIFNKIVKKYQYYRHNRTLLKKKFR